MQRLIKLTTILFLVITTTSCFFDGVKGNRNVITKQRNISSDFEAIDVSQGIDVFLTIDDEVSLSLEADENLHELIVTEVKDGVLHIYAKKNIWKAKSRKVYVTAKSINEIVATSGAEVKSENTIKSEDFKIKATSGAGVRLTLKVSNLTCSATSGADIRLKGKAENFTVKATSGSTIKAKDLEVETSTAKATSGANIYINVTTNLNAKATSGGDITYIGNPKIKQENSSSSGSIRNKQ